MTLSLAGSKKIIYNALAESTHTRRVSGETFGMRLRRLRLMHKPPLTQEDLAGASGVSRQQIHLYEKGETKKPTSTKVLALAEALDVSPFYLDTGREMPMPEWGPDGPPLEVQLRANTTLDDDDIATITKLIRALEERAATRDSDVKGDNANAKGA